MYFEFGADPRRGSVGANLSLRQLRVFTVVLMLLLGSGLVFIVKGVWETQAYAKVPWSHYQIRICLSIIAIGAIAAVFKALNKWAYGATEIGIACQAAWFVADSLKDGDQLISKWAAIVGAIYFVARGVGNIIEGWGAPRRQALEIFRQLITLGTIDLRD